MIRSKLRFPFTKTKLLLRFGMTLVTDMYVLLSEMV
jgi:hypothetical protein